MSNYEVHALHVFSSHPPSTVPSVLVFLRIKRKFLNIKIAKLCSRFPEDSPEPLLVKVLRKRFQKFIRNYVVLVQVDRTAGFIRTVPVSPNF